MAASLLSAEACHESNDTNVTIILSDPIFITIDYLVSNLIKWIWLVRGAGQYRPHFG